MTSWAERRREAGLEKDHERQQAELVPCPECEAPAGERCRNVHDGLPIEKQPAHWRRLLAAARRESTPAQDAWDRQWQTHHDNGRDRGMDPNAAIRRADRLMEAVGPRPTKETKTDA